MATILNETVPATRALWQRNTQTARLLGKLRECRALGVALELPTIMRELGVAQHGARLRELRLRGFRIQNHMERTEAGDVHSEYRLLFDPERDPAEVQP